MGLKRRLEQMRAKLVILRKRCKELRANRDYYHEALAQCELSIAEYKRLIAELSRLKDDS